MNEENRRIRVDNERPASFCVWVLLVDGLQVPPFDTHPDGDGSLRTAGLTADDWCAWVARVTAAAETERQWLLPDEDGEEWELDELFNKMRHVKPGFKPVALVLGLVSLTAILLRAFKEGRVRERSRPRVDPLAEWNGNDAVAERLAELWQRYGKRRGWARSGGEEMFMFLVSEEYRRFSSQLWRTPGPVRDVFLVEYGRPVRYRVGTSTALVSFESLPMEIDGAREAIMDTVRWLEDG